MNFFVAGNFAYAQGALRPTETDTAKAWLRSPTIDGLSRQATLSFGYWKTAAPPVLQVYSIFSFLAKKLRFFIYCRFAPEMLE